MRIETVPSPDLEVVTGNKAAWSVADARRRAFHGLDRVARYGATFRARRVMVLSKRMDLRLAEREDVHCLTSLPWFSAMIVVSGPHVLFERYSPDFGPHGLHSIQSITKTTMNLVIGRLIEQGAIDVSKPVSHYLPEIGSGYATASVEQVLNMDVVNDYSEDFADPAASYYRHEEAMGWRLPRDPAHELTQRGFLCTIRSADTRNRTGVAQYKDANTDVLGWIVERVSGKPLRAFLADLVDAAGLEGVLHITTDREGVPTLDGGASMSGRDLARYLSLFVRGGQGVNGEMVGSRAFIERAVCSGVPMAAPYQSLRYSHHLMVVDRMVGHGGWAGQFALANIDTGVVAVYLSVIEDEHGADRGYRGPMIEMLRGVLSAAGVG